MNEILLQGLEIFSGYVFLMIVIIVTINFFQKGLLFHFLRTKMSRGKLVLCEVHGTIDTYYKTGSFGTLNEFKYKTQSKKPMILTSIKREHIITKMGVPCVEIDEVNNAIWNREGAVFASNDPNAVDSLVSRALLAPQQKDLLIKLLLAFLIIFII